jgi:hypothetical protein
VSDRVVPEISRFFGIVVFMNYNDHPPPHFHVRYAEQRAIVAIESPPFSTATCRRALSAS